MGNKIPLGAGQTKINSPSPVTGTPFVRTVIIGGDDNFNLIPDACLLICHMAPLTTLYICTLYVLCTRTLTLCYSVQPVHAVNR
jgi:hypothetical protein